VTKIFLHYFRLDHSKLAITAAICFTPLIVYETRVIGEAKVNANSERNLIVIDDSVVDHILLIIAMVGGAAWNVVAFLKISYEAPTIFRLLHNFEKLCAAMDSTFEARHFSITNRLRQISF
jgi:hypothetical protein